MQNIAAIAFGAAEGQVFRDGKFHSFVKELEMNFAQRFEKVMANPWVQVVIALIIIATSAIDILDDISRMRKEHGTLIIGLLMLCRSTIELVGRVQGAVEEIAATRRPGN